MDEVRIIEIKEDILSDNKKVAKDLREGLIRDHTFMVNLMASPGAGKTELLLQTIKALKDEFKMGIIEADIDSKVDADKIADKGIKAVQIKTGGFCHVDAVMVKKALETLDVAEYDLLFVENVGNLVCPAGVDTGANLDVVILSVPEGDDKPIKYPTIFSVVDTLVISKIDYLELTEFDTEAVKQRVKVLNPDIEIFEVSNRTGEGIDKWVEFLKQKIKNFVE